MIGFLGSAPPGTADIKSVQASGLRGLARTTTTDIATKERTPRPNELFPAQIERRDGRFPDSPITVSDHLPRLSIDFAIDSPVVIFRSLTIGSQLRVQPRSYTGFPLSSAHRAPSGSY